VCYVYSPSCCLPIWVFQVEIFLWVVKQRELPPAILIGFLCGLIVEVALGGYKDPWCLFNVVIPNPDEVLE
jgi:hypothetical protein